MDHPWVASVRCGIAIEWGILTRIRGNAARHLRRGVVAAAVAAGALALMPASAAHADTYRYCPGYVIQFHDDGSYIAYWYDNNGNWGEVGPPYVNNDLVCGAV